MADVFISYAKEDRAWVKSLAEAIEAEGLSVWWDPELLPGSMYREAINAELASAKAIVVVWSRRSIASDYVRDEAEDGRKAHKLVPVLRDAVEPPHGFRQIQTADLSQWLQHRESPEFRLLMRGIGAFTGFTAAANAAAAHPVEIHVPSNPSLVERLHGWTRSPYIVAGTAGAVVLLAFLTWPTGTTRTQTSEAMPVSTASAGTSDSNSAAPTDVAQPETRSPSATPDAGNASQSILQTPATEAQNTAPLISLPSTPAPPQVGDQAVTPPSFDCSGAVHPDELIICGSAELAALDAQAQKAYDMLGGAHGSAPTIHTFMRAELKKRHQCEDANCVRDIIKRELAYLAQQ